MITFFTFVKRRDIISLFCIRVINISVHVCGRYTLD